MRRIFTLFLAAWLMPQHALSAPPAGALPRVVIALYEDRGEEDIRNALVHTMAEMPLNHLGLMVEYYRLNEQLPDIANRKDVRGIITWFSPDARVKDPKAYLAWAEKAIDSGKKFVQLGYTGMYPEDAENPVPLSDINKLLQKIGVESKGVWNEATYRATYNYDTPEMFLSNAPFERYRPVYEVMDVSGTDGAVHLFATDEKWGKSPLLLTGPHGGYASPEYLYREHERVNPERREWLIDALRFFRLAFATDDLPKPDTTTLAGRRIYYSHIDGDGWNNISQIEEYREKQMLSSEVVMREAIMAYPNLPVTLTLIAAEIDPKWVAVKQSREIAKTFFALPNVEAGSHTYSHPFQWQFFKDGNWRKEEPYLTFYPFGHWSEEDAAHMPKVKTESAAPAAHNAKFEKSLMEGYRIPRAYANKPFEIHKEIQGAIDQITPLLPAGKKIMLVTWPGNCSPSESVVALTRKAGVQNINGGDSRFDNAYPTYASLAPIGKQAGKERQIYASTSNENTYTDLWTRNFHAYADLVQTLQNSESPVRFKPINIYYHIYAGEKRASMNALLANLKYADTHKIAPITASHFTRIAEGFYNTAITPAGADSWRISDRGALDTIRFDHASMKAVDFFNSRGVVGQRHYQGSLYIYLDSAERAPFIKLKNADFITATPPESLPYLVESRWQVSKVRRAPTELRFTAQGFGKGEMAWAVPDGKYRIRAGKEELTIPAKDGVLNFTLQQDALEPVEISIQRVGHV